MTLGEVCEFRRGLTYAKGDEVASGGTAVLRAMNIDLETGELDLSDIRYVSPSMAVPVSKMVEPGTLLICTASGSKKHLGKTALIDRPMEYAFGGFMGLLVPNASILPKFLHWVMRSDAYWQFIDRLSSGTNINNLKFSQLKEFELQLPPLEEQKRIVAVLDEAFEGLDHARANAEANLTDARDLYDVVVGSKLANPEHGAQRLTLGNICAIQSGSGFPERYQGNTEGEFPFYKVSDMNLPGNEEKLTLANNYISEETRKLLRAAILPEGAIVFPKVGGAIATNKKRIVSLAGCVDNNVMGLIPDERLVEPRYLHEWVRAFDIYDFSNKANPPSITQATVSAWPIVLPSREQQRDIVDLAESLRARTEELKGAYLRQLADFGALRQSLLQKAFTGELT